MSTEGPRCPVCGAPLTIRLAQGRKSGKPFVMLISDRGFVSAVVAKLEKKE